MENVLKSASYIPNKVLQIRKFCSDVSKILLRTFSSLRKSFVLTASNWFLFSLKYKTNSVYSDYVRADLDINDDDINRILYRFSRRET